MRTPRAGMLVLAFDIGSSSTRTALFDENARRLPQTSTSIPYSLRYTADGGAELSPFIVRRAAARCLAQTLRKYRASRALRKFPIGAVAASSLWHALLGLDRKARPLTPIFTWADSRATDDAARLRQKISEKTIHARTGCMLRSTFWPSKLLWLDRTKPKLFARVATWASPVDWIFYQLFGATGCSASIASGTGLYDLKEGDWDEELCAICHIKRSQLVPLRPVVEPTRWPRSSSGPAAIFTAIGDGAAGNLGSGADHQRVIAINVGTSAAVRMTQTADQAARTKVPFGLFRYVVDENRSVMGGAVSNAGNLRAWCLRELQLTETQADRALSRTAAVEDALSILPFWVSERAPSWPDRQLGVVDGLNQSTRASDIYRAATVAVFYRLAQILELIEKATNRSRHIILSGGILHSAAATRLLADALARDIEIAPEAEASLEGAAIHALTAMGLNVQAARPRRTIKYDRKLASKHRQRRERQMALEKVLTRSRGWPL